MTSTLFGLCAGTLLLMSLLIHIYPKEIHTEIEQEHGLTKGGLDRAKWSLMRMATVSVILAAVFH